VIVVNMYDAKTHLSELVKRAQAGERIVLARSGEPLAELVPYNVGRPAIQFGKLKGKIQIADDFNDLSSEVADQFAEYLPETP
jgi:prevent-host-death family protein